MERERYPENKSCKVQPKVDDSLHLWDDLVFGKLMCVSDMLDAQF